MHSRHPRQFIIIHCASVASSTRVVLTRRSLCVSTTSAYCRAARAVVDGHHQLVLGLLTDMKSIARSRCCVRRAMRIFVRVPILSIKVKRIPPSPDRRCALVSGLLGRRGRSVEHKETLIRVQSDWNAWRTAEVRLGDLQNIHWRQPRGAPSPLVHGHVSCSSIVSSP